MHFYNRWMMPSREYRSGYLVIEEHSIVDVGAMDQFEESTADQWIDAHGGILLPGFVNAHTHCGMIPFRSLGDDLPRPPQTLPIPIRTEVVDEPLIAKSTAYASCRDAAGRGDCDL